MTPRRKTVHVRAATSLGVLLALVAAPAAASASPDAAPSAAASRSTVAAATTAGGWVSAWTRPMSDVVTQNLNRFTCRSVSRVSAAGTSVRVRLSNQFVGAPTTFTAVTVGERSTGAALKGSPTALTFGGNASVTVAAGGEAVSDPVRLTVARGEDLAVSTYLAGSVAQWPRHEIASTTSYCNGNGGGDSSMDIAATKFARAGSQVAWVTGVDVSGGAATGTVVTIGDSITDGYLSTTDAFASYPDVLSRRLAAAGLPLAVANAGISSNMVSSTGGRGVVLVDRFDRDVLSRAGVTTVIVMEGTNDLGSAGKGSPDTVIAGLTRVANQARQAGIRVIGGTIPPRAGCTKCNQNKTSGDAAAIGKVNAFVRNSGGVFDSYVDFAAVLADPQRPDYLNPSYASADQIHPNDAGYQAMADAIDLSILR